jgi:uncharacterized protein YqfA (UPF0365 family)
VGLSVRIGLFLAGALCLLAAAPAAIAQKSTEDGLRDCETLAMTRFKLENRSFKKFTIDRKDVEEDKFAANVGSQFVSTIYHGKATYQAESNPAELSFVCLHAGLGKGAVFVYILN